MIISDNKSLDELSIYLINALKGYNMNEKESFSDIVKPVEMLTIKECTQLVNGLKSYTIRKWIEQDKVIYIRTGEGKRGKFLVNKDSLLAMVNGAA